MLATTTNTLRQSRKNNSTIKPVSTAPMRPSVPTFVIDFTTVGDSSNSKLKSTSSGSTLLKVGIDA